jgi:hypothetical protein
MSEKGHKRKVEVTKITKAHRLPFEKFKHTTMGI